MIDKKGEKNLSLYAYVFVCMFYVFRNRTLFVYVLVSRALLVFGIKSFV